MKQVELLILSLYVVSFEISVSMMTDEILGRRFRLFSMNKNVHFREVLVFPF